MRRLAEARAAVEMGNGPQLAREAKALMKRADGELEDFVSFRHPRLVNRAWGGGRRESEAFEAGQRHGEALTLHRPISERKPGQGKLLR